MNIRTIDRYKEVEYIKERERYGRFQRELNALRLKRINIGDQFAFLPLCVRYGYGIFIFP